MKSGGDGGAKDRGDDGVRVDSVGKYVKISVDQVIC